MGLGTKDAPFPPLRLLPPLSVQGFQGIFLGFWVCELGFWVFKGFLGVLRVPRVQGLGTGRGACRDPDLHTHPSRWPMQEGPTSEAEYYYLLNSPKRIKHNIRFLKQFSERAPKGGGGEKKKKIYIYIYCYPYKEDGFLSFFLWGGGLKQLVIRASFPKETRPHH